MLPRLFLILPVLVACAGSHNTTDASTSDAATDAGPGRDASTGDAGECLDDGPRPQCVSECGDDGLIAAVCVADAWLCPPDSIDLLTCDVGCPDGLNPRDRDAPSSACSVEGATCFEGTQCGAAMSCSCEDGTWNCAVAEPDPVCWCGREPEVGDPCTGETDTCGECCPTADGPGWSPMTCVDGAWQPRACEEIACPPVLLECPVEVEPLLGTACTNEGQTCGDACCASAQCSGGIWQPGPDAECMCQPSPACGTGSCTTQQSCNTRCGSDDRIEFLCITLPAGCNDCECLPLVPGQFCEMVDGSVHISTNEVCG